MGDTVVRVDLGRVWLARNADGDADDAEVLAWVGRSRHPTGATLRATSVPVAQVPETAAVLLSRPFRAWGASVGANEHGVVVANEVVPARGPTPRGGLSGTDLVRLGLERAATARRAVDVITALLEAHGQRGTPRKDGGGTRVHHSFLIADHREAWVLETHARSWAVEQVVQGVRGLSNGPSIPGFSGHASRLGTLLGAAGARRARTEAAAGRAAGVLDLFALLRDHGAPMPGHRWHGRTAGAPCRHGGGPLARAVSTGAWVSQVTAAGAVHWTTATAGTCTGLFKPARIDEPIDLGDPATGAGGGSLWWRHQRLHRAVLRDHRTLLATFAAERDAVEAAWSTDPPPSIEAFRRGDQLLSSWIRRVEEASERGPRPGATRRGGARRTWRSG